MRCDLRRLSAETLSAVEHGAMSSRDLPPEPGLHPFKLGTVHSLTTVDTPQSGTYVEHDEGSYDQEQRDSYGHGYYLLCLYQHASPPDGCSGSVHT